MHDQPTHGTCQCGCGGKTSIAKRSDSKVGHIKGQPVAYILGHGMRGRTCHRDRQRVARTKD